MCKVNMKREHFVSIMRKALRHTISSYSKGEIGRNDYVEKINKINAALTNDKLGLNHYLD